MVGVEVLDRVMNLQNIDYLGVEDFADKMNFQATVLLLLAFCTGTTFKTYFLDPVSCYLPSSFENADRQHNYVNNYCWTEGTFAVPIEKFDAIEFHSKNKQPYPGKKITYYQWVPFVLGLQALLFYIPRVLWTIISRNRAGTDMGHLVRASRDAVRATGDRHDQLVYHVCRRLFQVLGIKPNRQEALQPANSKKGKIKQKLFSYGRMLSCRLGNWILVTYFVIKLLYLGNSLGQLYLLHKFLNFKTDRLTFGLDLLQNLLQGRDWTQTMLFPRVGMCAVDFRAMVGSQFFVAQCTLPINMINEKIFIFLWFWLVGISIVTAVSLPLWMHRVLWMHNRSEFVQNFLKLCKDYDKTDKRDHQKFTEQFLRYDGTFLLQMISLRCGDVVCAEIVRILWNMYIKQKHNLTDEMPPYPYLLYYRHPDTEAAEKAQTLSAYMTEHYSSNRRPSTQAYRPSAPYDERSISYGQMPGNETLPGQYGYGYGYPNHPVMRSQMPTTSRAMESGLNSLQNQRLPMRQRPMGGKYRRR